MYESSRTHGSETITASQGALIEISDESRPVLRLEGGHRLKLKGNYWKTKSAEKPSHDVAEFKVIDTPLGEDAKEAFRNRGEDQREYTLVELWQALEKQPDNIPQDAFVSEFHRRIVMILTILILPFLAIPFSIGRSRGARPYRFGVVLLILIAYNEIIETGALSVRAEGASPFVAIWLPFIFLATFSLWRFYRTAFSLTPDFLEKIIDFISIGFGRLTTRFTKQPVSE